MRILNQRLLAVISVLLCVSSALAAENDVDLLIGAMLGDTPIVDDLHEATDTIGVVADGDTTRIEQTVDLVLCLFLTSGYSLSPAERDVARRRAFSIASSMSR